MLTLCHGRFGGECMHVHAFVYVKVSSHVPQCEDLSCRCSPSTLFATGTSLLLFRCVSQELVPELPQDSSCLCLTSPGKSIDACDTWSSF